MPYCATFGRKTQSPAILNSKQKEGQDISLVPNVTEEEVVGKTAEVRELHKKVMV